jgi:hypothetical protein
MPESPMETLERWEHSGAVWRAARIGETEAVVDLCTCYGEPVDRITVTDPDVLRYLRERPRSDD